MHPDLDDTSPQTPAKPDPIASALALAREQSSRSAPPAPPPPYALPDTYDIGQLCEAATPEAFRVLFDVMRHPSTPPATRQAIAQYIIDRKHGKPRQAMDVSGDIKVTAIAAVIGNALRITEQSFNAVGAGGGIDGGAVIEQSFNKKHLCIENAKDNNDEK